MNLRPVSRSIADSRRQATGMAGQLAQVAIDDLSGWSHPDGTDCFCLRPRRADADALAEILHSRLRAADADTADFFGIRLALEEALSNAFTHGCADRSDARIIVALGIISDELYISVADQGPGFTPGDVPDPTEDGNIEIASGRGLLLMHAYMDVVEFNPRGNAVRLRKTLHCPAE